MILNRCRPGSAVLIVVLVLSVIMLSTFNLWRQTALTMDMVLKRQTWEQKYRVVEGVLHYGVAFCKNHFETIGKKKIELSVGTWQLKGHPPYVGNLLITPQDAIISLRASLVTNKRAVFVMSCSLERKKVAKGSINKKKIFVIHDWKVHA